MNIENNFCPKYALHLTLIFIGVVFTIINWSRIFFFPCKFAFTLSNVVCWIRFTWLWRFNVQTCALKRAETSWISIETETFCTLRSICLYSSNFISLVSNAPLSAIVSGNLQLLHSEFIESWLLESHENFSTMPSGFDGKLSSLRRLLFTPYTKKTAFSQISHKQVTWRVFFVLNVLFVCFN